MMKTTTPILVNHRNDTHLAGSVLSKGHKPLSPSNEEGDSEQAVKKRGAKCWLHDGDARTGSSQRYRLTENGRAQWKGLDLKGRIRATRAPLDNALAAATQSVSAVSARSLAGG